MDAAKRVAKVVGREWRAFLSDRLFRLLMVVFPLAAFGLFTAMFQQGSPENLPVAVCDMDRTALSRSIIRMADASSSMALFSVEDLGEGRRAVLSGRAYGLLVLSEGMEREVLSGRAPASRFYINNQIMLPAGVIKRAMLNVFSGVSAGVKLKVNLAKGMPETRARERLSGIHVASRILYNPNLDYRWYLYASICPFLMKIFIMSATVWSVGKEMKRETVPGWLRAAQGRVHLALFGKLLPLTLWFTLVCWAMLAFFFGAMELPRPHGVATLMGGTFLFVAACQAAALFLVAFTGELAKAVSMMSLYAGSAFVFAGVTFPAAAMPLAARIWHATLPLTHMVRLINEQALKGLDPGGSVNTLGALVAIGLVCGAPAWARLIRRLAVGEPVPGSAGGMA
ncbi:ABC transporter permease [Desulfoluna spongiiphila]|uniref:ABC-2 type transport system permease protein n=1 Tax=Desulfoluna spongiiphila TaxID=419481 RepID=A0A1G5G8P9_9BACT|nr:ABC transporter permease [Desulfoluna spongiiphila]SCY47844.1 ABC-2 type transport system permease protein [Desulfoluna spongiiphila]